MCCAQACIYNAFQKLNNAAAEQVTRSSFNILAVVSSVGRTGSTRKKTYALDQQTKGAATIFISKSLRSIAEEILDVSQLCDYHHEKEVHSAQECTE